MNRNTQLALPALALAALLGLSACGAGASGSVGNDSSSGEHGGGHSSKDTSDDTAEANDADVSFLTGMTPHHEQAVEMSEIALAADPPAEVAAIAQGIQRAQGPEIEQMQAMLADLGEQDSAGGHGGAHGGGHGGMMSDADMEALRAATGTEAARLYLEGMIEHHQGAIEASDTEVADGGYEPAIALAEQIRQAQAAEITRMQALLESL